MTTVPQMIDKHIPSVYTATLHTVASCPKCPPKRTLKTAPELAAKEPPYDSHGA